MVKGPAPEVHLPRSGRFSWERLDGMDGFVLADPFDEFLTRVDERYLTWLWQGLGTVLEANGVDAGTLTWGAGHAGYTGAMSPIDESSPLGFFGWVRRSDHGGGPIAFTPLGDSIAGDLDRTGLPLAVAGAGFRSWMCMRVIDGVDLVNVAPDDVGAGLELVVAQCADLVDWNPSNHREAGEDVCGPVADAIAQRDQGALSGALEEARLRCTPTGYRILVRGFAAYMLDWLRDDTPGIEPRVGPDTSPVVLDLAPGLSLTITPLPARRSDGWFGAHLEVEGSVTRRAPVDRDRLVAFVAALAEVAAGRAQMATLVSLGRAWDLVVGHHTVECRLAAERGDPERTLTIPTPRTTPGRLFATLRPYRTSW